MQTLHKQLLCAGAILLFIIAATNLGIQAASTGQTLPVGGKGTAAENWPQFRGPGSRGVAADDPRLPEIWSKTKGVIWKTDVPGRGWSSPIVWGDKIIVTTVVREQPTAAPKPGLFVDFSENAPTDRHKWMVLCFDWETGEKVWEMIVESGTPTLPIHLKNSYASETPVTDGERICAYFGNLGLYCFDMAGNKLWERKFELRKTKRNYGLAASPALHGDRLFILNDNNEQSYIVALDKQTGKEIWRRNRDEPTTWASPLIWENEFRIEIVTMGVNLARSYSLAGDLLWELGPMSTTSVPTPYVAHGMVYLASGLPSSQERPVYAVRAGAKGNVSLEKGESSNEYVAWVQRTAAPYVPSTIVYGDYHYTLLDGGFLTCHNAKTGEEVYEKQRIGSGTQSFTASPWAYNGKIFLLSENGDTFVVKAGSEYEELAINSLDEYSMASPAIHRNNLLIRTDSHLYRIGSP